MEPWIICPTSITRLEFNFGMGEAPDFSADDLQDAFNQTQAVFPFYTTNDVGLHAANTFYDGLLQAMLPPTTILLSDQATAKLQVSPADIQRTIYCGNSDGQTGPENF